jgi:hypothetical protein
MKKSDKAAASYEKKVESGRELNKERTGASEMEKRDFAKKLMKKERERTLTLKGKKENKKIIGYRKINKNGKKKKKRIRGKP